MERAVNSVKQIASKAPIILAILYAIVPFCHLVGAIGRYRFVLNSYSFSTVVLTDLSVGLTVLAFALRVPYSKGAAVASALLIPLSVVNGVCYVFKSGWRATAVLIMLCCICSVILMIKFIRPLALQIALSLLFSLLIVLFSFLAFIDFLFQDFSRDTLIRSVSSPQNSYIAEVISNDQGALGGCTFVKIRSSKPDINLLFGRFSKSFYVYTGSWGSYMGLQVSWIGEHTLMINREVYSIY